jgi:Pentapeptide repeats (8 copies)
VQQEQKPRERSFTSELVPDWRPTREQKLWAIRIVIVLIVLLGIITLIGLPFDITLWDWLDLLIIPIVLALGGYLFTRSENRRTQNIAEKQRDLDRQIADDRRQDDTLQAYLDGMSQLLTHKDRPLHRVQLGDSLSAVARARTLTVLTRLEGNRKGSVVQFLYESGLIQKDRLVLNLRNADLRGAFLSYANLRGAYLTGTNLGRAHLHGTHLSKADLSEAYLPLASLFYADLSEADLSGTDLSGANLEGAYLVGALGVTNEQLDQQARFLKGATMPDDQEYEDWLKEKKDRGNGENSSSS